MMRTKSHIVKMALRDAIEWRESLLDSLGGYSKEATEYNRSILADYKKELERQTKNDPKMQEVDARTVSLDEIRKMHIR
jgi:hypothetical protein